MIIKLPDNNDRDVYINTAHIIYIQESDDELTTNISCANRKYFNINKPIQEVIVDLRKAGIKVCPKPHRADYSI